MISIPTVNEGSSSVLLISFLDDKGLGIIPDSGIYRIDDIDSGVNIKKNTVFYPVDTNCEICFSSEDNRIINMDKAYEGRMVTVRWIKSLHDSDVNGTEEYRYNVKKLYIS